MASTITLAHALDDSHLRRSLPAASAASVDISGHHHPRFVRFEPAERDGGGTYHFSPFTGCEPEPKVPAAVYADRALPREQKRELEWQYEAARAVWSKARLRRQASPVLRQAVPMWDAWTNARDQLRATFDAFWQTPDEMWRAQVLRLTDAQQAAKSAAEAWDEIAGRLANLASDQVHIAGEEHELLLTDVAVELGLDATHWWIDHASAYAPTPYYRMDTPLVADLTREIDQQRQRLLDVAHLVADRALAHELT
ncbi:hypothetical protein J7E88_33045 [Streptomyces sp. ISL-10]|uniref:hypothetical protein n=1 Tax=Streptomyces sp. ISL-10 TaxID=2819172 RepID=UPI001BED12ED|nr:hypothetical protein [Streptomyces sp. ISL-10]MBT2369966.1 hypothetical protein [Streptomyces sp. ISL-10]